MHEEAQEGAVHGTSEEWVWRSGIQVLKMPSDGKRGVGGRHRR